MLPIEPVHICLKKTCSFPGGQWEKILERQLNYLSGEAERYPAGFSMFLMALSDHMEPPAVITAVPTGEDLSSLPISLPSDAVVRVLDAPSEEFGLLNGETTFYVCRGCNCLPPMNRGQLEESFKLPNIFQIK